MVEKSFEAIPLEVISITFMSDHYKRPQGTFAFLPASSHKSDVVQVSRS